MNPFFLLLLALIVACSSPASPPEDPLAGMIQAHPVALDPVARVSRFRSGVGHDYSDAHEDCRSMKHYFEFHADIDWTTVEVRAPVTGRVERVAEEQFEGFQVRIVPTEIGDNDGVLISLFHVIPNVEEGDIVQAGDVIGHHASSRTFSDISVLEYTSKTEWRYRSYFELLAPGPLAELEALGLRSSELVISARDRNTSPLACEFGQFVDEGTLPNWVELP